MNRSTLSMALIALAACLTLNPAGAVAQSDSTWLDVGTIKLKKGFTQTITIKGSDLEKMPFTNLAEAINVWAFGAYSQPNTLIYVIDGIAQADVNMYSVHDIGEVVLVQNALVQVNGVSQQQQLVLISTRKKDPGGLGLTFAAQANLANADINHRFPGSKEHSNTGFYQQYYAGLNKQAQNVQYGLSADWLHDPFPTQSGDSIDLVTPNHLGRLRLNGYADIQADRNNEFVFRMAYTTQNMAGSDIFSSPSAGTSQSGASAAHQFLAMPSISWTGNLGRGWQNSLQLSYITTTEKGDLSNVSQPADDFALSATQHSEHWMIRNHLSFSTRTGGWQITPALNITVENAKESYSLSEVSNSGAIGGLPSVSSYFGNLSGTSWLLTPSLDASYKRAFDIQAGLLYNLSAKTTVLAPKMVFPFATASTDLLAWKEAAGGEEGGREGGGGRSSLKLFAALAQTPNYRTRDYALDDYSSNQSVFYGGSGILGTGTGIYFAGTLPTGTGGLPTQTDYWTWGVGTTFSSRGGGFQASYHFERNEFPIDVNVLTPGFNYLFENLRTSTQRLGFLWKIAEDKGLHWQSGLNIAWIKGNTDIPDSLNKADIYNGDFNGSAGSWTGGWVNRFEVKEFSFGLDLLYHFNETNHFFTLNPLIGAPSRTNALSVQSLYFGYRLHLPLARSLEVYLDARNLWESKWSDLTDGRRYYGLGAKLGI